MPVTPAFDPVRGVVAIKLSKRGRHASTGHRDPVLLARLADGRLFAEVHRDPYKQGPAPLRHLRALAESAGLADAIDWTIVADVVRLREGVAVDVTRPAPAAPTGQPD